MGWRSSDQLVGDAEAECRIEPDGVTHKLGYVLQQVLQCLLGIASIEVDELRPYLGDMTPELPFADRSQVHLQIPPVQWAGHWAARPAPTCTGNNEIPTAALRSPPYAIRGQPREPIQPKRLFCAFYSTYRTTERASLLACRVTKPAELLPHIGRERLRLRALPAHHRTTIYDLCDRGVLPYFELKGARGRHFKREDLDALLEPGGQTDGKGTTRTQ